MLHRSQYFLLVIFSTILFSGCLKTEEDNLNPNIYKSWVWNSEGKYYPDCGCFKTEVRIELRSKGGIAISGNEVYPDVPDEIVSKPERCISDKSGLCIFSLESNRQISAKIPIMAETSDVADSISQATFKSNLGKYKAKSQFIALSYNAIVNFNFNCKIDTIEELSQSYQIEAYLKDPSGVIANAHITVDSSEYGIIADDEVTDENGRFSGELSNDATFPLELSCRLMGIIDNSTAVLDATSF